MNPFRSLLASGILILAAPASPADITRDEAVDVVLKILAPATLTHEAAAYLTAAPLNPGDSVEPFDEPARAFTVTAPVWFAWIDDEPDAFFAHRVRFVYIAVTDGTPTVVVQEWWPEVNGLTVFSQEAVDADPSLRVFSSRVVKTNP